MRAVTLFGGDLRFVDTHSAPTTVANESIVDVRLVGICETDLQLVRGYMDFEGVLGHEFVGIAADGPLQGERVVGEINCPCGNCDYCNSGVGNHCPNRTVLGILNRDGAFADQLQLPHLNLHRVPDNVPDELAVFTEPLAAAFQIPAQIDVTQFQNVAVMGCGRLGFLCAQVLASHGCNVTGIDKHAYKLALLEQLEYSIDTLLLDDALQNFIPRYDLVIDCTGSPTGLETALKFVKPHGVVVMKTTISTAHQLSLAAVVIHEITILGSRCGPFKPALQALANESINVQPLIADIVPLEDAVDAFQRAQQGTLKILLDVSGDHCETEEEEQADSESEQDTDNAE
ncbi:MDR/zinc-dependent alcohol dehydrogenase-like family protein [Calycomorphotria hydatis]|uniref:2-deoxy-scyllo-inosamine dehydrogenase n=1 Tax=Calycomorphotria hydatis TaxID=2528027 RepID=A0A517T5A4_9PLAN|nr:alcohol dehydrogenase catalytic domain-containing protein [Calycomorphotria hydatis]QDT63559.1 2-deoxy-scyllo-inosamine dehydrogenase [Calycomorphotria hydatis]